MCWAGLLLEGCWWADGSWVGMSRVPNRTAAAFSVQEGREFSSCLHPDSPGWGHPVLSLLTCCRAAALCAHHLPLPVSTAMGLQLALNWASSLPPVPAPLGPASTPQVPEPNLQHEAISASSPQRVPPQEGVQPGMGKGRKKREVKKRGGTDLCSTVNIHNQLSWHCGALLEGRGGPLGSLFMDWSEVALPGAQKCSEPA